jgi:prephenate dehydratase
MNIRLACDELAFLMIEIREAGVGIIPLENVRKGFRTVMLYDNLLETKDSKILVNVL